LQREHADFEGECAYVTGHTTFSCMPVKPPITDSDSLRTPTEGCLIRDSIIAKLHAQNKRKGCNHPLPSSRSKGIPLSAFDSWA
jgi:hypothetical protein